MNFCYSGKLILYRLDILGAAEALPPRAFPLSKVPKLQCSIFVVNILQKYLSKVEQQTCRIYRRKYCR